MESEIWEQDDRDLVLEEIIEDIVKNLKKISKSEKDAFLRKKLREILDEKKILE